MVEIGTLSTAVAAVVLGVFCFSSIPTKLGFYRFVAYHTSPSLIGYMPSFHHGIPWNYTFEDYRHVNLTGQTAIVTGGNAGIGFHIALALAQQGANVTLACRSKEKCHRASARIQGVETVQDGTVATLMLETSRLSSVKAFADAYIDLHTGKALDMLFLNAGTAAVPPVDGCIPLSEDGIEKMFSVNYVGHHLLYRLLEPMLERSAMARVVQTSSMSSFFSYSYKVATDLKTLNGCSEHFAPFLPLLNLSYGQSKLAQIIWTKALSSRLGYNSNIYVNAFHPGSVNSEIWGKGMADMKTPWIFRSLVEWIQSEAMWTGKEGALTGLFLGAAVDRLVEENIRGSYYHPQAQKVTNPLSEDEELQARLWAFSDDLVKDFVPAESRR